MKIDPKLKNRIRFNQLQSEARDRLRRFYHLTSASAALQIVQSGFIWSDTPELCPNFAPNRSSHVPCSGGPEIWLRFQYTGAVHLLPEDAPSASYKPNSLQLHLYEWPDMYDLQGMRLARIRLTAPCTSGLDCIGFHATEAFLQKCKTDIEATLTLTRLKRLTGIYRSVQVPADAAQRASIQAEYPPPHFSTLEIWQMRFFLWRRRRQLRATP
jgi:hypothetical protein